MSQSEQIAQAAFQAPINNLVVVVALMALAIVLLAGFAIWKVAPAVINLYRQQAETNKQNAETASKLTTIVGQNVETAKLNQETLSKNNDELVKQTASIDRLTNVTALQGTDFRAYQTLVSDNLSNHTSQVELNTAKIEALKVAIDALPEQVKSMIQDVIICSSVENIILQFKNDIVTIIQNAQAKSITGSFTKVPSGEVLPTVAVNGETT